MAEHVGQIVLSMSNEVQPEIRYGMPDNFALLHRYYCVDV